MAGEHSGTGTGGATEAMGPWALPGLALAAVCFGFGRFAVGFFVPVLRAEFELSLSLVGVIGSLSFLGYLGAILGSWILTERLGARRVALGAGGLATGSFALIAAVPGTATLSLGILFAGASAALLLPPLVATTRVWSARPRHDALSVALATGTALGVTVIAPLTLLDGGRWRAAFALLAAVSGAVTLWFARAVPAHPVDRRASQLPDDITRFADKPRRTGRLSLAAGAVGLTSSAVWVFGREVLERHGGLDPAISGLLWVLLGSAGLLAVVLGDPTRPFGARRTWIVTVPILALSTATVGAAAHRWTLAFTAAAGFGAAYVVLTMLLLRWGARLSPLQPMAGLRFALLVLLVGHAVGGALVGELLELASANTVFIAMGACSLVGALVPPPPGDDPRVASERAGRG